MNGKREETAPVPEGSSIGRYKVYAKIGHGGYGDIYLVVNKDTQKVCAMKVENLRTPKSGLKVEIEVLQDINGNKKFPEYLDSGTTANHRYLVMELLGPSISSVRRHCKDKKFSMPTFFKISIEMLRCIKQFHEAGYVHRDIKPSNFIVRPIDQNYLVLLDFGLSKSYLDPKTLTHLPMENKAGFKGTTKYASLNALMHMDQGRRDDVISWFYSIIEMFEGSLPWGTTKDKNVIIKSKELYREELKTKYHQKFFEMYLMITGLDYYSTPDYDYYSKMLLDIANEMNVDLTEEFDWMKLSEEKMEKISAVSLQTGQPFPFYSPPPSPTAAAVHKSYKITPGQRAQLKHSSSVCLLI